MFHILSYAAIVFYVVCALASKSQAAPPLPGMPEKRPQTTRFIPNATDTLSCDRIISNIRRDIEAEHREGNGGFLWGNDLEALAFTARINANTKYYAFACADKHVVFDGATCRTFYDHTKQNLSYSEREGVSSITRTAHVMRAHANAYAYAHFCKHMPARPKEECDAFYKKRIGDTIRANNKTWDRKRVTLYGTRASVYEDILRAFCAPHEHK